MNALILPYALAGLSVWLLAMMVAALFEAPQPEQKPVAQPDSEPVECEPVDFETAGFVNGEDWEAWGGAK